MAQTFNVSMSTFSSQTVTADTVGVAVDFSSIPEGLEGALAWVAVPSGGVVIGMGSTGVAFAPLISPGQVHGPIPVNRLTDMVLITLAGTQDVTVSIGIPG